MSAIVDMLVSALVGGAGVKALELVVSYKKDRDLAAGTKEKDYLEMEGKIRAELRADNESLRQRLKELEEAKDKEKAVVPPIPDPEPPDPTGRFKAIRSEVRSMEERLTKALEYNQSLQDVNKMLIQTIVDLRADMETQEAPKPPAKKPK